MADTDQTKQRTVHEELVETQIFLLQKVRTADNWYKASAAAQAFALVSGTLTSASPLKP